MNLADRPLRRWQTEALAKWKNAGRRGIVAIVTGGGKTIFALHCLKEFRNNVPAATSVISVPTDALLDQWLEEIVSFFDIPLKSINILNSKKNIQPWKINIGVINTIAQIAEKPQREPVFLIVDECHKSASPVFQKIFQISSIASLGLSATPERPYDSGLDDIIIPNLGQIIYNYTYKDALADKVIVPFTIHNIVFEFTPEEQEAYDKLTKAIQIAITKEGFESERAIALLLKRARLSNASVSRVKIALRLVAKNQNRRILIFHEDINSCELIHGVLSQNNITSGVYHSRMRLSDRIDVLKAYRSGKIQVLVSCRALDEGFNVPETEVGIIAASTATHRQRVQRLGRVLRPAPGKEDARIYSIVGAPPEIRRLAEEATNLDGLAEVIWTKA